MSTTHSVRLIENYIYLYHTDQFIILPTFPETIADSLSANYSSQTPLARSAPIFSYSSSGPRSVQVNLTLHRDMLWDVNYKDSNFKLEIGEDYIDAMIRQIQSIALPKYSSSTKMVDPPMIAVRFGETVFIKGVVNGGLTINYSGPIGTDNKYKMVNISFMVHEVDPYDAISVQKGGSYRGLSRTLERRVFKK